MIESNDIIAQVRDKNKARLLAAKGGRKKNQLNEWKVRAVRVLADAGFPQSEIGEWFGLKQQAVSKIVRRQQYASVD